MAVMVSKLIYLTSLLKELNVHNTVHINVSVTIRQQLGNPIFHELTKHIEMDWYFIGDTVRSGFKDCQYLCTSMQTEDMFVTTGQPELLIGKLGVLDVFQPPA